MYVCIPRKGLLEMLVMEPTEEFPAWMYSLIFRYQYLIIMILVEINIMTDQMEA